jgi:hypothetical protein
MRVYKPLNSSAIIHKQSTRAEFNLQADLYALLKRDGFDVVGNVTLCKNSFDLVVYDSKGKATAIIETKQEDEGARVHLDQTIQGVKYMQFGVPVILFWDLSKYDELKTELLKDRKAFVNVKSSAESAFQEASKAAVVRSLELLRNKLDVASFAAYDVASTLSKTDLANLEQTLETARDKVQRLYERF